MRGKGFGDDAEIAGIGITPAYAGKSRFAHYGERGERITPAYAGKSKVERNDGCKNRDPPRLCGEKFIHSIR